jgi:hypothetical protein
VIENSSRPIRPSDSAFSPGTNWSGPMPIIRRFERWSSYESAIAARTPRRFGPFAAQSRDAPALDARPDAAHHRIALEGTG